MGSQRKISYEELMLRFDMRNVKRLYLSALTNGHEPPEYRILDLTDRRSLIDTISVKKLQKYMEDCKYESFYVEELSDDSEYEISACNTQYCILIRIEIIK